MKLFIKNMVCPRCILVVKDQLTNLHIPFISVVLGQVELKRSLSKEEYHDLTNRLEKLGFEVIENKKRQLVEQIKTALLNLIYQETSLSMNLSSYLKEHLKLDYNYMSNTFSELENSTIEKYFIAQKIERVKELLLYDELSLSEISFKLDYSSVAHLSSQFKKTVGMTPTQFKLRGVNLRKSLDKL